MQMFLVASKLDWAGWLRGFFGALISGGAGAVGSGFGSIIVDPKRLQRAPHWFTRWR